LLKHPRFKGFAAHPDFAQHAARSHRFVFEGPWMTMTATTRKSRRNVYDEHWVLRSGDGEWVRHYRHGAPRFKGDRLYWFHGNALHRLEYPSRKPAAKYEVPHRGRGWALWLLGYWERGDRLLLSTGQRRYYGFEGWGYHDRVRIHEFDLKTGKPLRSRTLREVPSWVVGRRYGDRWRAWRRVTLVRDGDLLVFSGPDGLYGYALDSKSSGSHVAGWLPVRHAERRVAADGRLEEWKDAKGVVMGGGDKQAGEFMVKHEDLRQICLAVRQPASKAIPWLRSQDYAGGHWLECSWSTNRHAYRWGIGRDVSGSEVVTPIGGAHPPPGLTFGIEYDPARREIVYEMRWSLHNTYHRRKGWENMGLSLTLHDETSDGGSRESASFGRALNFPRHLSWRNSDIRLLARPKITEAPRGKKKGIQTKEKGRGGRGKRRR
jgi:hypothetical protein